jgi:hypothetical protein
VNKKGEKTTEKRDIEVKIIKINLTGVKTKPRRVQEE